MNLFAIFYQVLLPVFAVIGLAALFDRWTRIDTRMLTRLVIYLFAPFYVLTNLISGEMAAEEVGTITLMAVLSTLLLFLGGWLTARLLKLDRKTEGAFLLSIAFGNVAGMGVPLARFAFGEGAVPRAVLFFAIASALTNTLGVYAASRGRDTIRRSFTNIFRVPLLYATLLGLALNYFGLRLPLPLERLTTLVGQSTVPVLLVLLGAELSRMKIGAKLLPLLLASLWKLVLAALIGFGLAALLQVEGLTRQTTILMISMPTALFATAFSNEFGSDGEFSTAVILVTSLASLLTLGVLLTLL